MRHYRRSENSAGLVEALPLDEGGGRDVAVEDVADGGVLDVGELNAKAYHHSQDEESDEEFEQPAGIHGGAVGAVEDEDEQDVHDRKGTARNERNSAFREHGERYCGPDHFGHVGGDDGAFTECVAEIVEPARAVSARHLGEVHACYGAQVDAEGLQEDGEDVGQ